MKVTKAEGSESATFTEIDLELPRGTPPEVRRRIERDVGDYLVERVLQATADANSPVAGESFPALSRSYAKEKKLEGGTGKPDLTLHGDMMDALDAKPTGDGRVEVGFFGDQAWKADGHLKFSGAENNAPKRRFLPAEGQHFTSEIEGEVEKIIADGLVEGGAIDPSTLEGVSSEEELYSALRGLFPDMAKAEIRAAILRSATLTEMLDELDLLDLL